MALVPIDGRKPLARQNPAGAETLTLALCFALAGAAYAGIDMPRLLEIWRQGSYFDTDDAMRMVQVRDLLAGQSWYDMTAWRLDPPHGMFSHWSRVVDAPLAALILLFRLFLDPVHAERAARIAFPALLTAGLFLAGLHAARVFAGRAMRLFGLAAMLFCGVLFWQFPAGRIDHHASQIVALLTAVAAMASCFGAERTRDPAALSGVMTALSLSIGLENLPFLALVAAAPMILFLRRGLAARETLQGYALGLAGALIPLFFATVGPQRWLVPACDALSAPYFLACLAGSAAYALIARFGAAATSAPARLAVAGLAALAAAAPLTQIPLAGLADPFHGMDPLVRKYWLDPNPEVISILRQAQLDPALALQLLVPTLVGLLAALFGVWRARGAARARWAFLAAQIAIGLALGSLHVRAFSTAMPLAAIGLLAPIAALRAFAERQVSEQTRGLIGALTALVALFALSNMGFTVELPDFPSAAQTASAGRDRCMNPASYAPLRALAPGLAASTISPGSYLLAQTDLSVLAAPYHRNNHGNRAALDILFAPPDQAENFAREAGARYLILCWTPGAAPPWQAFSPEGLATQITRGSVPGWLRPVEIKDTPLHVYEIVGAGRN
jgi:hypothetical protein